MKLAANSLVGPAYEAIAIHTRACLIADIMLRSLETANYERKSLAELRDIADETFKAIMQEYFAGIIVSNTVPTTIDGVKAVALHLAEPRYSLHLRRR